MPRPGAEEANAWRHPVDLVSLCEAAVSELPALLTDGLNKRGWWCSRAALAKELLTKDPSEIVAALAGASSEGATAIDLAGALAYAAALRVARFGTANEHSDWEAAHHTFTYCNAVHQLLKRIGAERAPEMESPELLRGVFHGAMRVYLTRFLNLPPAPAAGRGRRWAGRSPVGWPLIV